MDSLTQGRFGEEAPSSDAAEALAVCTGLRQEIGGRSLHLVLCSRPLPGNWEGMTDAYAPPEPFFTPRLGTRIACPRCERSHPKRGMVEAMERGELAMGLDDSIFTLTTRELLGNVYRLSGNKGC